MRSHGSRSGPLDRAAAGGEQPTLAELLLQLAHGQRLARGVLAEFARAWQLSDVEFLVLWLCGRATGEGVAQHHLAAEIGVSAAQTSGLVERLRKRGLLVAQRLEHDRRRQHWQLTASGRNALQHVQTALQQRWQRRGGDFSPQDQQTLSDLLRQFAQAVDHPAEFEHGDGQGLPATPGMEADNEQALRRAS